MSLSYSPRLHDRNSGAGQERIAPPSASRPPPSPPQIPGLRHVDDRVLPGFRRRRTGKTLRVGKRFVPEFVIEDAAGRRIRDHETLDRIRKLAIPPAWEDVWICPFANGHIQATGRDARRRKQYRYHARWREERDRTKYSRMVAFGNALPELRRRVNADLKLERLPRRKVLATVVRLLETTFIRVGNEEYARANKSFGLTTLKDRHVDFAPGEVRFHFRGKSGVAHQVAVHDPRVARIVRRCRDLPGQELFQYLSEDGKIQTIDSADVNEYIREIAGRDFTAKDFRTWAGTVLAARAFQQIAAAAQPGATAKIKQASALNGRRTQKDVVRAISQVAEQLGNTPAVCRKCYVHPTVIASFLDGKLMDALTAPAPRRVVARPRGDARSNEGNDTGLRPDEAAVLALLTRAESEVIQALKPRSSRAAHRRARPPAGGAGRTRRAAATAHA